MENNKFDPMTGAPIGQSSVYEETPVSYDPMTGQPIYGDSIRRTKKGQAQRRLWRSVSVLWPEIIKFINAGAYDGVIFGGDMLDYCSVSNMETFRRGYQDITLTRYR